MEVLHLVKLLSDLSPNLACKYVRSDEMCVFVRIDTDKVRLYTKTPDNNEFEFAPTFIQALAEGIEENKPFNTSQILNNKGSNRAVIDSIIAHTSEFYWTQEGRSKFLVWVPSKPHNPGELVEWADINALKTLPKVMKSTKTQIMLEAHQIIYYGAPGTGKSHEVKEKTGELLENGKEVDLPNVFRTTFHPDTDYAAFVGCYKPCMVSKEPIFDSIALKSKLLEIKNEGGGYACHKFGYKYWESLDRLSANEIKDILHVGGFSDNMAVEVQKGIALAEKFHNETSQIAYTFVPQVFTDAYVYAYSNPTEQTYLVIEEINRGNCAQIFGDLFQLLDRKDGKSEYKIKADKDLALYLKDTLGADSEGIKDGKLCLPANLHILATMNTSDQSLFPMDSAFKRRWEWEYVPIEDAGKGYTIKVNGHEYDWWTFLEAINKEVFELTNSEDKQMGYFFVRRPDGVIDAETLVSKVYFYLWNDVFKDYDLEGQKAFKKDDNKAIAFKEFFAGSKINEALAEQVLLNLDLTYTDHPEL